MWVSFFGDPVGMGQNLIIRVWAAGLSPCFHLPGFHFGYIFLNHSHVYCNAILLWVIDLLTGNAFALCHSRIWGGNQFGFAAKETNRARCFVIVLWAKVRPA